MPSVCIVVCIVLVGRGRMVTASNRHTPWKGTGDESVCVRCHNPTGGCVECCTPDMLRGRNIDMWLTSSRD